MYIYLSVYIYYTHISTIYIYIYTQCQRLAAGKSQQDSSRLSGVTCVIVVERRVARLLLSPYLHPLFSILARDCQEKSFGSMMRAVLPRVPSKPPD